MSIVTGATLVKGKRRVFYEGKDLPLRLRLSTKSLREDILESVVEKGSVGGEEPK